LRGLSEMGGESGVGKSGGWVREREGRVERVE
jgi:hypothetical protein